MKRALRNVAIIAHVDHGKTTLVDQLLRQSGTFRDNQQVSERVMDSGDIERERGITILAKNCAVEYQGTHINIIDTPGHADFGGEVERVLSMVDGVLLLVDAVEGPMPQTRFVTRKALALGLKPIVVVNKVDRPGARPDYVVNATFDLFDKLGATEEQLDFPVIYASGLSGYAGLSNDVREGDMRPLFDAILQYVPQRDDDPEGPLQMQIISLDYSSYVGKIGVGRINRGRLRAGQDVLVKFGPEGDSFKGRVNQVLKFKGLDRELVEQAEAGDIVLVNGIEDIGIGCTLMDPSMPEALPLLRIDEPTLTMNFMVNTSPLAGREGKFVTSRQLRDRLDRELKANVALRVNDTDDDTVFEVCGRGELHLSILIETMRRQGYEFQVSRPEVLFHYQNGERMEPVERLLCDVPQAYAGAVIEKIGRRRGVLESMAGLDRVRLSFLVPSRGLFGYRSEFLTDTRGEGIMSAVFSGYEPYRGDIPHRNVGSLVCFETGEATQYGLYNVQDRGNLFVTAQTPVYAGMICGQSNRPGDIVVNICKMKHVTNVRNAASAEDSLRLVSVQPLTLEESLEFIDDDELLEVTPKALRIRKRELNHDQRMKAASRKKNQE